MPTLNVNITAISGSTGTYDRASGPGTVASNGDIDFRGSGASAAVDIAWTLANELGKTFSSDGFSAGSTSEFSNVTLSNANKTLTVTDANDPGQQYEYSLTLSDGTVLDPKIINR
jgi:hypothetical protein